MAPSHLKKKSSNVHDRFFRKVMERPEVLNEFLETHLPRDLLNKINLKKIQRMPKSFITDLSKDLIADLICKVKIDKHDGYLVFLIEHQSTPDQLMPFRVLQYMCEIISKHLDNTKRKKIPLVVPLVVYNGKKTYKYSNDIKELVDAPKLLVESYFLKPFQLIDLNKIDDGILREKLWAGVVSLAMKHIHSQNMTKILSVLKIIAEIDSEGERRFSAILLNYVVEHGEFSKSRKFLKAIQGQVPVKFEEEIVTLAQQFAAEGAAKSKAQIALNLLRETGDPDFTGRVTGLSPKQIKKLQEQLSDKDSN